MRHQSRHIPPRAAPELPLISESEVRFTTARSGGPGGQNVNKVCTKVHLHFNLWGSRTLTSDQQRAIYKALTESNDKRFIDGEIVITSQEHRSQLANKVAALEKLNCLVRALLTPKAERVATETPASVDVKRREDKRAHSERKALRRNRFDQD